VKRDLAIIRVDPVKRTIVKLVIPAKKNLSRDMQRICRSKRMGYRELLEIEGKTLVVAAGIEVDEAMKGWRLQGGEDTAGIGVLYGALGAATHMVDVPVNVAWVEKRLSWLEGEDVSQREERATEVMAMLSDELCDVVRRAMPTPEGDMWLLIRDAAHFDGLKAIGVTTPLSPQKLTPVGITIFDRLVGGSL